LNPFDTSGVNCDFGAVTLKRKWILRTMLGVGVLLVALVLVAVFFPQDFLCVDSGPVKADVIIVLGGGAGDRPQYAAELFKTHAATRIIVSGAGDDEIDRMILLSAGVPQNAIEKESHSRTTSENARFTLQLLRKENIHSAIIVTSWYHSRRALNCFEHYGPDIQFYSRPSPYNQTVGRWTPIEIRRIYLEYPKTVWYWIHYGVYPF
jgi:uncharacterized SAM-binding protein YcdF (DUF218 family)